MNTTEPEAPRTAAELKSSISGLEDRLSDAARRGDNHGYRTAAAELAATKVELAGAERRELNEAAAAHRLKQARKRSGVDEDGSLESSGYSSPGALIADRIRRGPVTVGIESYLRQAGIKPSDPA